MSLAITNISIPGIEPLRSGKVREIFDAGDNNLLLVATDRISAFDSIFPNGIPGKGVALTRLAGFWFKFFEGKVISHFMTDKVEEFPEPFCRFTDLLRGRSMLVKKAESLPFEFIVRGYLDGSAWAEYKKSGTVWGREMPEGMRRYDKLPEVMFTPTTKAHSGHDEQVGYDDVARELGEEGAKQLINTSLRVYEIAHNFLLQKGIYLLDTKFEFGILKGDPIIIDEILTPDSSRFLIKGEKGQPLPFDKQFVRDSVREMGWDGEPPAPVLPDGLVRETKRRYEWIVEKICG